MTRVIAAATVSIMSTRPCWSWAAARGGGASVVWRRGEVVIAGAEARRRERAIVVVSLEHFLRQAVLVFFALRGAKEVHLFAGVARMLLWMLLVCLCVRERVQRAMTLFVAGRERAGAEEGLAKSTFRLPRAHTHVRPPSRHLASQRVVLGERRARPTRRARAGGNAAAEEEGGRNPQSESGDEDGVATTTTTTATGREREGWGRAPSPTPLPSTPSVQSGPHTTPPRPTRRPHSDPSSHCRIERADPRTQYRSRRAKEKEEREQHHHQRPQTPRLSMITRQAARLQRAAGSTCWCPPRPTLLLARPALPARRRERELLLAAAAAGRAQASSATTTPTAAKAQAAPPATTTSLVAANTRRTPAAALLGATTTTAAATLLFLLALLPPGAAHAAADSAATAATAAADQAVAAAAAALRIPGLVGDSQLVEGVVQGLLLIFFSEIGDKTFFIALLLALKRPRGAVFAGTFGALAAMTAVSVALGRAVHALDELGGGALEVRVGDALTVPVDDALAVLLLVYFGVQTLRGAAGADARAEEEREEADEAVEGLLGGGGGGGGGGGSGGSSAAATTAASNAANWALIASTFGLVFAAEWGDKSFLATIALAAAGDPLGVTLGAVAGHGVATGLAVAGGSALRGVVSERTAGYVGGSLFLVFAAATAFDVVTGAH
jgi:putative Ca2+/H+ antiporter (TMEM165/GDT1 family)